MVFFGYVLIMAGLGSTVVGGVLLALPLIASEKEIEAAATPEPELDPFGTSPGPIYIKNETLADMLHRNRRWFLWGLVPFFLGFLLQAIGVTLSYMSTL